MGKIIKKSGSVQELHKDSILPVNAMDYHLYEGRLLQCMTRKQDDGCRRVRSWICRRIQKIIVYAF